MAKIVNISEIHPTLGFTEFDILQQRDFVNRWMNDTGQGETWTWGLGRYAMATVTYRFNDLSR